MRDPDEHTFDVYLVRDFVHVKCQSCNWRTGYPIGDARLRELARSDAIQHRASAPLKDGESAVERMRR